jgi:hypothetical protein
LKSFLLRNDLSEPTFYEAEGRAFKMGRRLDSFDSLRIKAAAAAIKEKKEKRKNLSFLKRKTGANAPQRT